MESNDNKPKAKKSIFKKLAFASCDILGGGSFNIINFLYPGFLALVIGLNAYLAGMVLLIAKIWDAIIDPIIGFISDKTKSKFGKRRVYLIFVSPFVALSFILLFFPFTLNTDFWKVIICLLTYMLFTLCQSFIMVPYYSLSSEISSEYNERASYNSYRLGFSIFSSILCVAIPGMIVNGFKPGNNGYIVMGLIFGALFALSALITGLFSKEEIVTPPTKDKFSFKTLIQPLKLRVYRQYIYLFLVVQMAMAVMSGLFFFYVDFYVCKDLTFAGESNIVGMIGAALMFAMQIVALPLYLKLIKLKGKTWVYRLGGIIWIISALALLFLPFNVSPWLIFVIAAIMGFGISAPGLVPHTMFGDVVDAGEIAFKERLDGQMGGFTNFVNQAAQALGLALAMFIIGAAGFKEQVIGEPIINSQPETALMAIKFVMAFTPLLLIGIGMVFTFFYKIDHKKQLEMKEIIRLMHLERQHEEEQKKKDQQS